MIVYLINMRSDLKLFIRRNFNGFSYDGGQYCCDLDELFFKKEAIETDELYLYYTKYSIDVFGDIKSEECIVKFFDFTYGVNNFVKSIVCDRLLLNIDNDYNTQDLIDICINDGVLPKNTKADGAYLHSLCGNNSCSLELVLDRDFIV